MRPFAAVAARQTSQVTDLQSSLKIRQPIGVGSWSGCICFGGSQKDEVTRTDVKLWRFGEIWIVRTSSESFKTGIKLKSLILAQIERWRNALHMQVERQHGLRSGGEWRTGE